MNLKNILKMNYIGMLLMTVILMVWVLYLIPEIYTLLDMNYDIYDPVTMFITFFSGLMIVVMTFKVVGYKKGL